MKIQLLIILFFQSVLLATSQQIKSSEEAASPKAYFIEKKELNNLSLEVIDYSLQEIVKRTFEQQPNRLSSTTEENTPAQKKPRSFLTAANSEESMPVIADTPAPEEELIDFSIGNETFTEEPLLDSLESLTQDEEEEVSASSEPFSISVPLADIDITSESNTTVKPPKSPFHESLIVIDTLGKTKLLRNAQSTPLIKGTKLQEGDRVISYENSGFALKYDEALVHAGSMSEIHVTDLYSTPTRYLAGETAVIKDVGSLTLQPDGSFSFIPDANYHGHVPTITYTINTNESQTLDITVLPYEEKTLLAEERITVEQSDSYLDVEGNVLDNDFSPDGNLEITGFSISGSNTVFTAGSEVNIEDVGLFILESDGSFTLSPNEEFSGFVPQVIYLTNTEDISTLNITILPMNETADTVKDQVALIQGQITSGNVLENDALQINKYLSAEVVSFMIDTNTNDILTLKSPFGSLKISAPYNSDSQIDKIYFWSPEVDLHLLHSEIAAKITPGYETYYGIRGESSLSYQGLRETLVASSAITVGIKDYDSAEDDLIGYPIANLPNKSIDLSTLSITPTLLASTQLPSNDRIRRANKKVDISLLQKTECELDDNFRDEMKGKSKTDQIKIINLEATRLMQTGQHSDAKKLLLHYKGQKLFDKNSLFILGLAASKTEDYPIAEKQFEELLSREETAHRVRLELAAVQFKQGKLEEAKGNLALVKASRPPQKVGENIEQFLNAIDSQTPKEIRFSASMGYLYDDNVNAGPSDDMILIYNLPFVLDPDAKENVDRAVLLKLAAKHNIYTGEFFNWKSDASIAITDYNRINAYDTQTFALSSGPVLNTGNWEYSLPMSVSRTALGHEYDYFVMTYGLSPQIAYSFDPQTRLRASVGVQNNDYNDAYGADSTAVSAALSVKYFINQSNFIEPTLSFVGENAKNELNSYNMTKFSFAYFTALYKTLNLYINPSYSWKSYQKKESAFNGELRQDYIENFAASLSWLYQAWNLNISLAYNFTHNGSSIDLYSYDRNQYFIFFTKEF